MNKYEILLSTGSVPWFGLERASNYAHKIEYDSLEFLPLRQFVRQAKQAIRIYKADWLNHLPGLETVQSIHQSWVLDNDLERKHGLEPRTFDKVLRLLLFPKVNDSREVVAAVSAARQAPVVIHDIPPEWTSDSQRKEFAGGLLFEISSHQTRSPEEIKKWLEETKHNLVADTRDDQSIVWAREKLKLKEWQDFWRWVGFENIKSIQLTLIGKQGMNDILNHQETLAEQQFLWLNKQGWNGPVTVEVNPLTLFMGTRGKIGKGLAEIGVFVRKTLDEGKPWSG